MPFVRASEEEKKKNSVDATAGGNFVPTGDKSPPEDGPPEILGARGYPEARRVSVLGEKEQDPYWQTHRHPFIGADVFGRGFIDTITAGNAGLEPLPEEYGRTTGDQVLGALGAVGGISAGFGLGAELLGGVAAPVLSKLSPLAQRLALGSSLFSGYEASRPADSLTERMANAGKGAAMGLGMSLLPVAPVVGKAMEKPLGSLVGNSALMTLMNKAHGMSWKDSIIEGVPFAAGGTAIHLAGSAGGSGRSVPQRQVEKSAKEVAPERASVTSEIEGVPVSRPMSDYAESRIKSPSEFVDKMVEAAESQTGAVSKEKLTSAASELKAENKRRIADGKKKLPVTKERIYGRAMSRSVSSDIRGQVSGGLEDVKLRETVDKRRTIQQIVGGKQDTPIERNTQRLGELGEIVKDKLEVDLAKEFKDVVESTGVKTDSPAEKLMNRIADEIPPGTTPEQLDAFMRGRGADIIAEHGKGIKPEELSAAINGAPEIRNEYERQRVLRDKMSNAFGGVGFEGRKDQGYVPKVAQKVSAWRNPIKRLMQETEPVEYRVRKSATATKKDPIPQVGPGRVRSSREKMRTDSEMKYPRDYRGARVAEEYTADTANRIANQPVISATKGVLQAMKDELYQRKSAAAELRKGAKEIEELDPVEADRMRAEAETIYNSEYREGVARTAEALDGVIQASYNDIRYGVTGKMLDKLSQSRPGMAVIRGSQLGKRIFNMAKYKLNLPFIALRQWSSSGQSLGLEQDIKVSDLAYAFGRMWSGEAARINKSTYTGNRKSLARGTMRNEATGQTSRPEIRERSAREKAMQRIDDWTDKPTNKMEEMTNRFAVGVAEKVAERRGLTGRAKVDFISDIIARMQSEYHRESMAEIRRNPVANFAVPAQSFSLEVFNNLRFSKSNAQRAKIVTGVMMANLVYQWANGYLRPDEKDERGKLAMNLALDTVTAIFPGSSMITAAGPSKGMIYPAGMLQEVIGDVSDLVMRASKEEDQDKANILWERAAEKLVKNIIPAGGQIARGLSADVMLKRGLISEEEFPQAAALGWWTTAGGKEYLRRISGVSKGGGASSGGYGGGYGGSYGGGY